MDWFGNWTEGEQDKEKDDAAQQAAQAEIKRILLEKDNLNAEEELEKFDPETVQKIQAELEQQQEEGVEVKAKKPPAPAPGAEAAAENEKDTSESSLNNSSRRGSDAFNIFSIGNVAAKFMGNVNKDHSHRPSILAEKMKKEAEIRAFLQEHGEDALRVSDQFDAKDVEHVLWNVQQEEALLKLAEHEASEQSGMDYAEAHNISNNSNALELEESPSGQAVEVIQAFSSKDTAETSDKSHVSADPIEASRTSLTISDSDPTAMVNQEGMEDTPLRSDTVDHPAAHPNTIEQPPEIQRSSRGQVSPEDVTPPTSNTQLGTNASSSDQEALQSHIQYLESTVSSLQEQLAAATSTSTLSSQQQQQPIAPLPADDELTVSFQKAQEEVEALRAQTKELQASLEIANDTVQFLQTEKDTFEQIVTELKGHMQSAQEQNAVLQTRLDETQQERDDALQAKETLKVTVRDAEVFTETLQGKLQEMEADQPTLQESTAKSRGSQGEKDLSFLARGGGDKAKEFHTSNATFKLESLEEDLAEAEEIQDTLAQENEALKLEMATLTREKEAWTAERQEMEAQFDKTMDQLVDATEHVAELKAARDEYREQGEKAVEAQTKAERSRRASLTMITSLETTLAQKEADMDSSRATTTEEKSSLESKLKALEATVASQKDQLEAASEQLDTLEAEKAEAMTQREEETQRLRDIVKALEKQIEELRERDQPQEDSRSLSGGSLRSSSDKSLFGQEELLRRKEEELQNAHEELRASLWEETQALRETEARLQEEKLQKAQEELRASLWEETQALREKESRLRNSEEELEKWMMIAAELEAEKEKMTAELVATQSEEGEVTSRGQIETPEPQPAEHEKLLADLSKKDEQLQNLEREVKELEKVNTKLLDDLEVADAENEAHLTKLDIQLASLRGDKSKLSAELETFKAESGEVQMILDDLSSKDDALQTLKKEMNSLEKVNTKLLADLESADAENDEQIKKLQSVLETLQDANSKLSAELEAARTETAGDSQRGHVEVAGLKAEYEKLLHDLSKKDEELEDARRESTSLERVNTKLLADLESSDAENSKAMEQLVEALEALRTEKSRLVADLDITTKEKNEQLQKLQEQLKSTEEEKAQIQEQAVRLEDEKTKLDGLQADNERVLAVNARLLKTSELMEEEMKTVKTKLDALQAEKAELVASVESKTLENVRIGESFEALELSLKQSEASVENLKETMGSFEQTSGAGGEELQRLLSEKEEVSSRALEQEALADKKKRELEKIREELAFANVDKESLSDDLEVLRKKVHEADSAKGKLESSLKESGLTIDQLRETISMLETAGEDMLKAVEEEKQAIIEQLESQAETDLEDVNEKLVAAKAEKDSLNESLDSARRELHDCTAAKKTLEVSLRESNTTVESLRETITMLETAGEEMLKAVEEEKQALVDDMELKTKEQLDSIRTEKQALETTIDIIRKGMQEAGVARGKAEASLRESEATVEKLRETIAMLESAGEDMVKAVEEEKETLVGQVEALESRLAASEQAASAASEKLALMATEKAALTSELETTREALEENCASLETSTAMIQKLKSIVTSLKAESESGPRSLSTSRNVTAAEAEKTDRGGVVCSGGTNEKESLEEELAQSRKRASELEANVDKNRSELVKLSSEMQRVSDEKTRVKAQLKDGKTLIHQASSQLALANEKISNQTQSLESLRADKRALELELANSSEARQAAVSAKEALEGELENANAELELLREAMEDAENQQANDVMKEMKMRDSQIMDASIHIGEPEAVALQEKVQVLEQALVDSKSKLGESHSRMSAIVSESYELEATAAEAKQAQSATQSEYMKQEAKLTQVITERDRLKGKVKALLAKTKESHAVELEEKVQVLEQALAELEDKLEDSQSQLEASVSSSHQLGESQMSSRCRNSDENQEMEASLVEVTAERDDLQVEVEELTAKTQVLERKTKQSRLLLESNQALMQKASFLEVALKDNREKLEQAEERLTLMVQESYKLEEVMDNERYEKRKTVTQNEELQAKLAAAEATATDLKGQVESLMEASKSTGLEVTLEESQGPALKEANARLEETTGLEVTLEESQEPALKEANARLEETVQALQAKLDTLASASDASESVREAASDEPVLLSKLRDAEEEATDLREQVEEMISRSEELESIADEEEALLREQVDTLNAWNLALEANLERSDKELQEAHVEVEALKASKQSLELALERSQPSTQVQERSTSVPMGSQDNNLQEKVRALTARVGRQDDALAEKSCKISELEVRLEDYIGISADLKMRLARKTSMLSDLEEELADQTSTKPNQLKQIESLDSEGRLLKEQVGTAEASNVDFEANANKELEEARAELEALKASKQSLELALERAQSNSPNQAKSTSVLVAAPGDQLQEKCRALTAKLGRQDDTLAEKSCKISELEVRLDEYIGTSADLKMRLARKSAMISELEEELEEKASGSENQARGLNAAAVFDRELQPLEFTSSSVNNNDQSALVGVLEKEKRALKGKVGKLEDAAAEKDCKVSELEARLEDYIGTSADLKMRLARKSALVSELEEELEGKASEEKTSGSENQARGLNAAAVFDRELQPLELGSSTVDNNDQSALVEVLEKEKSYLKGKVGKLEDAAVEKDCKVSELEARLEDYVGISADLKMRLARKTATIADLEKQIADATEAPRSVQNGTSDNTFAAAFNSSNISTPNAEELEKENQILTVRVARTEANLKQEKTNLQEQKSKIGRLEDTLAEKDIKITELAVRLEEYVGISSDLKMRLARRTAAIAELKQELDETQAPGKAAPRDSAYTRDLPKMMFEHASRSLGEADEEPDPMSQNTPPKSRGLPSLEETSRSSPVETKEEEQPIPLKDQTPSQQLQACMEDAKANEALFDQIVSLVDFAEQKKKRLKLLNERLETAMQRSRSITTKNPPTSLSDRDGEMKTGDHSLLGEQLALQKTVQHLETQWKETKSQLESVHKMNLKLEATLDHITKERESAIAARSVLESSLREAQGEVRSLRLAVEAMEAENPPSTTSSARQATTQGDVEVSERNDMDPERTTIPVGEMLRDDKMALEAALERRARECREYLTQANARLAQMEAAISHERQELEETIETCEQVVSILSVERYREIRLLDVVMSKVLHMDVTSVPVVPV